MCFYRRCAGRWFDIDCKRECVHGKLIPEGSDNCVCDDGWSDDTCTTICSMHGVIIYDEVHQKNSCKCDTGWRGDVCDQPGCPGETKDCSGHGECNTATHVCDCDNGWTGYDTAPLLNACDKPDCPGEPDCNNNGTCDGSLPVPRCVNCLPGYMGPSCEDLCTHGVQTPMDSGICVCEPCYTGKGCNSECNDQGTCVDGEICECNDYWKGPKCLIAGCPNDCSGIAKGTCNRGNHICTCEPGNIKPFLHEYSC